MLGYAAIQTHEMRAAAAERDAYAEALAENRKLFARFRGELRVGALSADALEILAHRLGDFWRQVAQGAPHRGALVIPTPLGGRRLTREDLPIFFCVPAETEEQRRAAGALLQKLLQLYGAAHLAAGGKPQRIAELLQSLLPDRGHRRACTISGMMKIAKGTQEDPGPEWAAPLRPKRRTLDAKRLRLLRDVSDALERTGQPAGTGAPGVTFTRADLKSVRAWLEGAEARLNQQEEAHQAITARQPRAGVLRPEPAAGRRPAPPAL
jgi:hypothetical protein